MDRYLEETCVWAPYLDASCAEPDPSLTNGGDESNGRLILDVKSAMQSRSPRLRTPANCRGSPNAVYFSSTEALSVFARGSLARTFTHNYEKANPRGIADFSCQTDIFVRYW
jgi:hypothetical protein